MWYLSHKIHSTAETSEQAKEQSSMLLVEEKYFSLQKFVLLLVILINLVSMIHI